METVPQIAGLLIAGCAILFTTLLAAGSTIERNGTFGIRTSWSLSSEEAWRITHRTFKPYAIVCAAIDLLHVIAIVVAAYVFKAETIANFLALSGYLWTAIILFIGVRKAKIRVRESTS